MAFLDLGTLKIGVTVDGESAKKNLNEVKNVSQQTGESIRTDWNKVASNLNKIGTNLSKYITLPIVALSGVAVKLASDMEETTNKIDVAFGENAATVKAWADKSIESMGIARQSALDAAATFGDMATGMGFNTTEAAKMATSLVQLSADLASFKNISIERANTALTGVYTGETEALKGLGIVMTEANLEQFAMNQNIAKTYSEMSQTEKVMLRYQYVMSVTNNAQGDFARTSGGLANQGRMLKENVKELGTQFGEVLSPMINKAITGINGLLKSFQGLSPETKETIVTIGLIVAAIAPALVAVSKVITAINTIKTAVAAANIEMSATMGIIGAVTLAVGLLIGGLMSWKQSQEELDNATREQHHKALDETASKIRGVANIQTEAAETTQTLTDKLKEMAETDPDIDIKTNAEEVKPSIENLQTAIGNLLTDTDDLSDSIDDVNTSLSDYVSALTEARKATTIEHIMNLTQAYRDNLITQEQFNQYVNESIAGYKEYKSAISGTTSAFDEFVESFKGEGKLSLEQTNALLSGANAVAANGTPLGDQLDSAAERMSRLAQASNDGTIAQGGYNVIAQQTAGLLSSEVMGAVNSVISAYNAYNVEVSQANAIEAQQRADTQANIDSLTAKKDALDMYIRWINNGNTAIEAFEEVEKRYGINSANSLKESFNEKYRTLDVGYNDAVRLASQWASDIRVYEENLKADSSYIAQQRKNAILDAEKKLQSDLGSITTNWTDAQIDEFARFAQKSGLKLDDGFIAMLKSSNKFVVDSQKSFNDAGEFSSQSFAIGLSKILPYLVNMQTTANGEGYKIGNNTADGVAVGISKNQYKAINAAVKMVKVAIAAAQKAGDIRSPSKKTETLIGKQLAAGVGVGWENEIQNVVKKVQISIGNITSGGAKVAKPNTSTITSSKIINQNNNFNFTTRTLSPYEQQLQTRRLSRELAGAFS